MWTMPVPTLSYGKTSVEYTDNGVKITNPDCSLVVSLASGGNVIDQTEAQVIDQIDKLEFELKKLKEKLTHKKL